MHQRIFLVLSATSVFTGTMSVACVIFSCQRMMINNSYAHAAEQLGHLLVSVLMFFATYFVCICGSDNRTLPSF